MNDFCQLIKTLCPHSYQNQMCGYAIGENKIENLKKCPNERDKEKRKRCKENGRPKKYLRSWERR